MVERPRVVYSGEFDTLDRDERELLALRWEHVDFVGGLMHVRRNFTDGREKVPKGKRVRSVPMMPEVIDTLGALKEREHFTADGDLVFCLEVGEHLDHFKLRKRFYAAGLRRIRC
jgi:integrase